MVRAYFCTGVSVVAMATWSRVAGQASSAPLSFSIAGVRTAVAQRPRQANRSETPPPLLPLLGQSAPLTRQSGWRKRQAEKYTVISPIDQGAFGVVVKASSNETGEIVAIKRINLAARSKLQVIRELSALRNCHHVNIVALLDAVCSADTISLVLEHVDFSLKMMIGDEKRTKKNEVIVVYFFKQILKALSYLHSRGIMHRDIKPDNILITAENVVKLADFGQACLYYSDEPERVYEEQVGTRWYRAPELLFGLLAYSPSIDTWSAGCVLAEMLNVAPLFPGHSDIEQISRMFRLLGTPTAETWPGFARLPDAGKIAFDAQAPVSDWRTVVPGASPDLLGVVSAMLQLAPERRLAPAELLRAPVFRRAPRAIAYRIHPSARGGSTARGGHRAAPLAAGRTRKLYTLDSILADMSL